MTGTATGPTLRSAVRSGRGPVLVALVALAVVVGLALLAGAGTGRRLDPRSFAPGGSHALAQLMRDRGQHVDVVTTLLPSEAAVVVPFPEAADPDQLAQVAASGATLLLVAPTTETLSAMGVDAHAVSDLRLTGRDPGCALPAATVAGRVRLGGVTYRGAGTSCYDGTLIRTGNVTVVGSAAFLTNERLDQEGDAALALALLDRPTVQWLLPVPGSAQRRHGLLSVLPSWVGAALLQLVVAVAVLALWRARRLGRVVVEPLPVVVRAAETVEGRGRLYRTARARDRAADALRTASLDAAARRLGLGAQPAPEQVVAAAAGRTGRDAAELSALLYGPVPADDAHLVRLADDLARFDSEVCAP